MTREEVKQLLPILVPFAEGKVIECRTKPSALRKGWRDINDWVEIEDIAYWSNVEYRIKPESESKYRPYTHVLFINGYRKDSPRIEKEIVSITIGKPKKGLCPDKWLDTEFFIIKFK